MDPEKTAEPAPPEGQASAPKTTTKELLESFAELEKEFANELKEIREKGLDQPGDPMEDEHAAFLRENWTLTADNLVNLFRQHWSKEKWKGLKPAFIFLGKFVLKQLLTLQKQFKEHILPLVKEKQAALVAYLKSSPARIKAWFLVTDPIVWTKRALKGLPAIAAIVGVVWFAKNYHRLFPPETFEDLEEEAMKSAVVDLKDPKRIVEHVVPLPPILVLLKPGKTRYRLLQVEISFECDSGMTLAEMTAETTLARIKDEIAAHLAQYKFEEMDNRQKKENVKRALVEVVQKFAPEGGKVYNIYVQKWIFAPSSKLRGRSG